MKFLAALVFGSIAALSPLHGHESRPLAVFIEHASPTQVQLRWRTPPTVAEANAPALALSTPCRSLTPPTSSRLNGAALYECPGGLQGVALRIAYPSFNPSISTLLRLQTSGGVETFILPPDVVEWALPTEPQTHKANAYFALGVVHILAGIDHVLFLLGLLLIARTPRRVLATATGFTLSHSLTLALVALDVVAVSTVAVEATIALSIVFVAAEIARNDRTTLAWRRPTLVAGFFGLIHGAGFASALGELGLPPTEKIAALLFFNLGVEIGQVMLIATAFGLYAVTGSIARKWGVAPQFPRVAAYGLGSAAAFWLFERLWAA